MADFISMHSFHGEIVDCRRLQIEFRFNRATLNQMKQLALLCVYEVKALLEDAFFLDWGFHDRRVKESTLLSKIENAEKLILYQYCGNALTSAINNRRAIDKYNEELFRTFCTKGPIDNCSIDYWDTYNELFHQVTDPDEIQQNLLKLFRMENRYVKREWYGEDVVGDFLSCPYRRQKNLFFGIFTFRIALPCLGSGAITFSNKAVSFLKKTVDIVPDVSGRVILSPIQPPSYCSNYMHYFGGSPLFCQLGREPYMNDKEWTYSCFFEGVDWYNLLSPLQTSKLVGRKPDKNLRIESISNGGSSVTTAKDILQTQVSDLCAMKQYLYPVLYPGGIKIPIKPLLDPREKSYIVKPRWEWEQVPVLENEIKFQGNAFVIKYQTDNMV